MRRITKEVSISGSGKQTKEKMKSTQRFLPFIHNQSNHGLGDIEINPGMEIATSSAQEMIDPTRIRAKLVAIADPDINRTRLTN